MIPTTRLAIFGALLCGALAGCGEPSKAELAQTWISVEPHAIDRNFLQAMLRDDVSTSLAPKPSARFVLSKASNASAKYESRFTALLLDSRDGCSYRIHYVPARWDDAKHPSARWAKAFPGAPQAGADLLGDATFDPPLNAPANPTALTALGPACAASASRHELVAAKSLAGGDLALRRAFAVALPGLRLAASEPQGSARSPGFALISRELAPQTGAVRYAMLEAATGCEWRVEASAQGGLLRPLSIEPEACLAVAARAPSAPRPAP